MTENFLPIIGPVPALEAIEWQDGDTQRELVVKSWAPYQRFAVEIGDNGLDSFGLREGNYGVFRAARWPDRECQVCLVRFGEEVTVRLVEGINATMVTLRVSGDRIEPLELEPTDFSIVGILDGVIDGEFARVVEPQPAEFDWGC